ncbi:MAG TPA: bifunctional YncE family protein/alkaline phosphatase family protein, partial [Bacteroidota bacterium]|nr:bifunctional YncE family protein/alkaline phosphatase family protein [Bacteroidota bacterium]
IWVGGVDIDERAGLVYAAGKESRTLTTLDIATRSVVRTLDLPATPYTCLVARVRPYVFVSLWGGGAIAFVDRTGGGITRTVRVGNHPCDMVESPDGGSLYVANAADNSVSVIDIASGSVRETLETGLFPGLPEGSTPNGVALSADGGTLYVANADNNYIAVFDVRRPGDTRPAGFIPSGWYPTCVALLPTDGRIIVANGKGGSSRANPGGPNPSEPRHSSEYIGSLFMGSLSRIDPPDGAALRAYTAAVYADSRLGKPAPRPGPTPLLPAADGTRAIRHVFYIIKENRTYDQVFGDIGAGNSDPSLCLFGDSVTPNIHALARQFVLLDNLYADAEVSADGHNWTMGAYATDYVEKTWPTQYGGRGGEYEYEGGYPDAYPASGYFWDDCARNGVSYRTYGEFARNPGEGSDTAAGLLPSLAGHTAPRAHGWDLDYSDIDRYRDWEKEFTAYEASGDLPAFQTIKLPNDHTSGTRTGALTPRAFVAQNDQALGMIVDRISHSRYWATSAIFVIEDDAQNGPDHVDAHRTEALVVSPWTKRHYVDSELYSTSSMVRTMELILGLPAMSQYDSSATPMFSAFSTTPDASPYASRHALINLEERNGPRAYGAARSGMMDFTRADAAPERELNEIVWRSVRGPSSPVPAPVRSAFVVSRRSGDED